MIRLAKVAVAAAFVLTPFAAAAQSEPVRPRPKPPAFDLAQADTGGATVTDPIPVLPECAPDVVDKPEVCDSLSEQLDATGGVIRPQTGMDGEIYAPAPDPTPGTTPVIPPHMLPDDPATSVDESTATPM